MSGLLLLGLAFYGEPAVYLHQAGAQWDALMDRPAGDAHPAGEQRPANAGRPTADQSAAADDDVDPEREARLEREVARLQEELTAKQASLFPADGAGASGATPQAPVASKAGPPAASIAQSAPSASVGAGAAPPVPAAPVPGCPRSVSGTCAAATADHGSRTKVRPGEGGSDGGRSSES